MLRKNLLLVLSTLLLTAGCSGGNSGGSNDEVVEPTPPAFVSPHPDDWTTSTPAESGFDEALLDAAFDYVMTDGFLTQAALVIKDGKLIKEDYRGISTSEAEALAAQDAMSSPPDPELVAFWSDLYGDRESESPVTSWSSAKSFTSMLIGIAIEQGHIESVEQPASEFITEWSSDERKDITIQQILDMRSGLVPICQNPTTLTLGECTNPFDGASGGNIVYSDDQLSACINRALATPGPVPWSFSGTYNAGDFLYSNCDTQILGEIVFRATNQDPGLFAKSNLFDPLNISASWWRDNAPTGQANGNYLTYCCLDSTARDFAKFGYMLLLGGIQTETGTQYSSYVETVLALNALYRNQFWGYCADGNPITLDCDHVLISTVGFDGQFILIDQLNELVIVRNGLYQPFLNASDERKMQLSPGSALTSNWTGSLPRAMGYEPLDQSFSIVQFHNLVVTALDSGD